MRTKHILLTGILGWLGGIGTALVGGSCDLDGTCPDTPQAMAVIRIVDSSVSAYTPLKADKVTYVHHGAAAPDGSELTAPPEVFEADCLDGECTTWVTGVHDPGVWDVEVEACGKTYRERVEIVPEPESCHLVQELVTIGVDGRLCDGASDQQPDVDMRDRDPACDMSHHTSVFVQVFKHDGNQTRIADVERVWYEHDGERMDALCVQSLTSDTCAAWIAGQELTGDFTIFAEYCDTVNEKQVTVKSTDDGCHPETEYLVFEADTTKCITNATENPPPPPDPT